MTLKNGKQPLLILLGPTACGKTRLSLDIAERFNAEIISGDSMQIYREMNIGTAKIRPDEQRGIRHHMIDIVSPFESFSVAEFHDKTLDCIKDIQSRGCIPFVVGGTGLYLSSLLHPYDFGGDAKSDVDLRKKLKAEYDDLGSEAMHRKLSQIDPVSAQKIHPNDAHRIIRALEVYQLTGKPISEPQKIIRQAAFYDPIVIGITLDRNILYQRINQRVDNMVEKGLVREVQNLIDLGLTEEYQSMQGIGYRQMMSFLEGKLSFSDAVALIKRDTRRFAKRQMTWFRRMENIHWFDIGHYREESALSTEICAWIAGQMEED